MEDVSHINQNIGLDVYMNCVLVNAGIRNAMLIQPADYNEIVSTDPITAGNLKALKEEFPELIQSDINGETIISKHPYKSSDITSPAIMGNILGFPCDYTLEHTDEPRTAISINVLLTPGNSSQLITYVCNDDKMFKEALQLAKKAEAILDLCTFKTGMFI